MEKRKTVLSLFALSALFLTSCRGNTLEECEDIMNRYYLQEGLDADYSTTVIDIETEVKTKDTEVLSFYGVSKSGDSIEETQTVDGAVLFTLDFAASFIGDLINDATVFYDLIDMKVTVEYTYNGDLSDYIGLSNCEGTVEVAASALADGRVDEVDIELNFTRDGVKSKVTIDRDYEYRA